MKQLNDELRGHRKRLGLSQEAMARKFGVSLRTYQRWEKGLGVREYKVKLVRSWKHGA